jgi:ribose-phosphate pyrophosphokinase
MMLKNDFKLFGLSATRNFSNQVAKHLNVELCDHKEMYFADCEPYVRSKENVRNGNVFVIQSLYSDETESVSDKFTKLLFFVGSLKDASAAHITVVIPYLSFQRQDRKVISREPITTKYFAQALESVGVNRLLTMDVHNLSAFQNSFRIMVDNLEAKNIMSKHIAIDKKSSFENDFVVLSPDVGGMTRAKRFRDSLSVVLNSKIGLAYLDKTHDGNSIKGNGIIGNILDKDVIVIDDMISSGSTISECQKLVDSGNGRLWGVVATHGLFVKGANINLEKINKLIVSDTIETPSHLDASIRSKITTIKTSELFGEAIRRTYMGESISDLIENGHS